MNLSSTHILVILDRSGSMAAIRDDVIGGFNTFVKTQQGIPGAATLTLIQFDSQDPFEIVHRSVPIASCPQLSLETFVPRGGTPLLDAMGRALTQLQQSLSNKLEFPVRPDRVVVVIVTDGQENASREFKKDQVMKIIADRQAKDGWEFLFLSADASAIEEARGLGIPDMALMQFSSDSIGTARAFRHMSDKVSAARAKKRRIGFAESGSSQES